MHHLLIVHDGFLGTMLQQRLMAAATDMAEYMIGHYDLEKTIPKEARLQWIAEIKAWENNKDQLNPYEIMAKGNNFQ